MTKMEIRARKCEPDIIGIGDLYRKPAWTQKAGALLAYGPYRLRAPVRSCARFPCGSHHVRNSWRASLLLVANGAGFAVATAVRRAYNDRYIRQYDDLNQSDRLRVARDRRP